MLFSLYFTKLWLLNFASTELKKYNEIQENNISFM